MMLSNKWYDALKWVALVALDAVGLFYQTMATIWGWPFGDQILSSCVAVSILIGTLIGISSATYKGNGGN